jgi:DDE superfamily endonuclease
MATGADLFARPESEGAFGGGPRRRVYEVAELFEVSVSYIYRALARRRLTGIATALPKRGRPGRKLDHHLDALMGACGGAPGCYVGRAGRMVDCRARREGVHRDDVGDAGGTWHHAQKKTCHAAEQEREDVAAARQAWRASQADLRIDRLVFIDETWATTNMTRRHGRALKGERLVAAVPHGHWKTTTFIGALRSSGLSAPAVIDGAVNGDVFLAYVCQVLAPTLRPGDIVIMDNLSSHKIAGVREAIEATGAELRYLLPYSPDLNPDRTGIRQAQSPPAQNRRPIRRGSVDRHRTAHRPVPSPRVHQLLAELRLCTVDLNPL